MHELYNIHYISISRYAGHAVTEKNGKAKSLEWYIGEFKFTIILNWQADGKREWGIVATI